MNGQLLHSFYCLDIAEVLLLVAVSTIAYSLINRKVQARCWWRWLKFSVVFALVAAITYITLGSRDSGSVAVQVLMPFHSYREVQNGGNIEIYRSNFMNVVFFYPAGLLATSLLPKKWSGWCRCLLVVFALTAMSAGIEFLQYHYSLGRCEIDDVIHNTLGAFLGSFAVLWLPKLGTFLKNKIMHGSENDA